LTGEVHSRYLNEAQQGYGEALMSEIPQSEQHRPQLPRRVGWVRRQFADILFVARRDKKWWLVPLLFLVLMLGLIVIAASMAGPLAPFIYPFL
jgi:hypothetical protein